MNRFLKKALPVCILSLFASATMAGDTVDAAIGGAVGGAAGAVLGSELGGREGAIAGAAVGAAVGTAVATSDNDGKRGSDIDLHSGGHYKKGGPPPHAYRTPPGHVKNGKAKW